MCLCLDRRPAFGSCREGVCCVCVPTGDLLSGLVGRVCLCICPDRRPAFGSCREGVCVCVPTGDLLSGLVGRVCVVYMSRPATCFRVL